MAEPYWGEGSLEFNRALGGGGHKNIREPYEGGGAWEYNWALREDQINFIFTQLKNLTPSSLPPLSPT